MGQNVVGRRVLIDYYVMYVSYPHLLPSIRSPEISVLEHICNPKTEPIIKLYTVLCNGCLDKATGERSARSPQVAKQQMGFLLQVKDEAMST